MEGNRRRSVSPAPKRNSGTLGSLGRFSQACRPERVYREQSDAKYLVLLCIVVAAVVAAFAFHLHVRSEAVRLGYEASKARETRARLLIEKRELRLEIASLKSPERVETEARERLDMEIPDHQRIIPISGKKQPRVVSGGVR